MAARNLKSKPLCFVGLLCTRAELLHGRFAMLGFAVTLINEVRFNGAGPIAQVRHVMRAYRRSVVRVQQEG